MRLILFIPLLSFAVNEFAIKKELIDFSLQVERNLKQFLSVYRSPKKNPYIYAYYMLVNARELAIKTLPPDFNANFLKPIDEAIKTLKPKVKIYSVNDSDKDVILETLKESFEDYKFSPSDYKLLKKVAELKNFHINIKSYMEKFINREAILFGDVFTPLPPLKKEVVYLSEAVKTLPSLVKILKPSLKLLVNQIEIEEKTKRENLYQYYIKTLEKRLNGRF